MGEILGLIWIFVLYVVLIPILCGYLLDKISSDSLFNCLCAYLISAVVFIVFSCLNMNFREYEYQYTQNIVAVQDSETMLISRYSSDSEMYYYFMVKNGDTYKPRKASQNVSTIKYTNEQPKLEVFKKESTNKFVYFFMPIKEYVGDYKYDFYVPEGTIKEEFNIDLD